MEAYADDLILISTDQGKLREILTLFKDICSRRKFKINYKKLVFLLTQRVKGDFEQYPIRKQEIYLELPYRIKLDVDFELNKVRGKIKFIKYKLYGFLKKTDLRIRCQISVFFCKPLIRMYVSIRKVANSQRGRTAMESTKRYSRWLLRKFIYLH